MTITAAKQPTVYMPEFQEQKVSKRSWESCPVIDPSVEHLRKPKSTVDPGSFLALFDWHT